MDSTELTYSTEALGKCIHREHVGQENCLQAVGMRTNRFFGGEGDTEIREITHQSQQILRG